MCPRCEYGPPVATARMGSNSKVIINRRYETKQAVGQSNERVISCRQLGWENVTDVVMDVTCETPFLPLQLGGTSGVGCVCVRIPVPRPRSFGLPLTHSLYGLAGCQIQPPPISAVPPVSSSSPSSTQRPSRTLPQPTHTHTHAAAAPSLNN